MNADNLARIALNCMMLVMAEGASYEEAQAIFSALSALMKQISITPNADDTSLIALAEAVFEKELKHKIPTSN